MTSMPGLCSIGLMLAMLLGGTHAMILLEPKSATQFVHRGIYNATSATADCNSKSSTFWTNQKTILNSGIKLQGMGFESKMNLKPFVFADLVTRCKKARMGSGGAGIMCGAIWSQQGDYWKKKTEEEKIDIIKELGVGNGLGEERSKAVKWARKIGQLLSSLGVTDITVTGSSGDTSTNKIEKFSDVALDRIANMRMSDFLDRAFYYVPGSQPHVTRITARGYPSVHIKTDAVSSGVEPQILDMKMKNIEMTPDEVSVFWQAETTIKFEGCSPKAMKQTCDQLGSAPTEQAACLEDHRKLIAGETHVITACLAWGVGIMPKQDDTTTENIERLKTVMTILGVEEISCDGAAGGGKPESWEEIDKDLAVARANAFCDHFNVMTTGISGQWGRPGVKVNFKKMKDDQLVFDYMTCEKR